MQKVEIRFNINPKTYTFLTELNVKKGDYVLVETSLGQAVGVVDSFSNFDKKDDSQFSKIIRIATKDDISQNEKNKEKAKDAISIAKELSKKFNLEMDIVNAEYSFDGSKVLIDFISENRVDFRDLVKELANKLKTRIELRQIGIRDQAKMVGELAFVAEFVVAGAHLKDFEKVSIKMAKVQGLSLNPTKISGACGRLMCCLEYENDYYSEVYPKLPKVGSQVSTPDGVGTVEYANALKQIASVKLTAKDGSSTIKDYSLAKIKKIENANNKKEN